MDPLDTAGAEQPEPRRPLLMDPAGARPSGFAPPTGGAQPTGPSKFAAPAGASSILAGSAAAGPVAGSLPGEAAFGPVSQVVRVSVRTASSRLDLVLPDRSTIAETLETVLELAPRSLREQAIAHGGWILRTADGQRLASSATLLDHGIVDGNTLYLAGVDSGRPLVAYDDIADAVATAVRDDPSGWPAGAGRAVALAAAGVFGVIGWLSLLWSGPPWPPVAITLCIAAVVGAAVAGWLSRGVGDSGAAVLVGILAVGCGSGAATVATVDDAGPLLPLSVGALGLGAASAMVAAVLVVAVIGRRAVPLLAIAIGALVGCFSALCCLVFSLPVPAWAAIVVGMALCLMPAVPRLALALAGGATDEQDIDPVAVGAATRRAIGYVTAQLAGLCGAAVAGCVVLAVSHDATAQVLAAVAGVGLLLRARLFRTAGQRLPLAVAGIGALAAVLLALMTSPAPASLPVAAAGLALAAMLVALLLAILRGPLPPEVARGLDLLDVLIAVVVIPLVAAMLGLFAAVRGIGG